MTDPLTPRATGGLPDAATLAELVRLPAALSTPGDSWTGAAAAGLTDPPRAAMPLASSLIYLGGMALNDWADRDIDALERPERPIPSGRVAPLAALGVGAGMVVAGVAVAGAIGGRPALRVAAPLAGAVWTYDVIAKDTAAGPLVMAACRTLDVLLGAAGGDLASALPAALVVGGHTVTVTQVSRHEVHGGPASLPRSAAAATAVLGAASLLPMLGRRCSRWGAWLSAGAAAIYATSVGGAYLSAAGQADETGQVPGLAIRPAVGAGVMGVMPLQASLLAAHGADVRALAVAALAGVGRALRARRAAT